MAKKSKSLLSGVSFKAIGAAVTEYRKQRKAGTAEKLTLFEDLGKFFTKTGTVKKRETRYKPAQQELLNLKKQFQDLFGQRAGKKKIQEASNKAKARKAKAAQTYAKQHGAKDNRFTKVAREQTAKYGRMVDIFATSAYEKLKEGAYGIRSDIVEKMADEGFDSEDAETFLNQILETMNDLPDEALAVADQDTFWNNLKEISGILSGSNAEDRESFSDVLKAYMQTDDKEGFMSALQNYTEAGEDLPFSTVWQELQEYDDPGNMNNMYEVVDSLRGE